MSQPLLKVEQLHVEFPGDDGVVNAVNGADFHLNPGDRLALVGESASGKSVTALTLMQLSKFSGARVTAGKVLFNGEDLLSKSEAAIRQYRGKKIAMIFQNPMTSLNPYLRISEQIGEVLKLHLGMNSSQIRDRTIELLQIVGIPAAAKRYRDYPHQFSGGMRQRVMIAMAISCQPELLIADEPTTALDVSIQAQIMQLLDRLSTTLNMATILITHDLAVVAGFCQRVCIMYAGRIVEHGAVDDIFNQPKHPYTKGLLASVPDPEQRRNVRLSSIPGQPPNVVNLRPCCPFFPRCSQMAAVEQQLGAPLCQEKIPPSFNCQQQQVSCWLYSQECQR